ncbi:MAG TPA: type VI secretion system contractile sheath large subunit [Stellaceae bacterium]|jgi:type VI secretion system protein ImpC|nr:type VI secretion system contractile sheath large subunit [Stellaceae bacterium]
MELNFGMVSESGLARKVPTGAPFRLAVLGDFAAAANRGRLETGDELARHKPLRIDVDNIDQVIERLKITLSLPLAEGAVEFPITCMDDFHPDQIYEKVELFSSMADMRRKLTSKSAFAAAQKELVAWRDAPEPLQQPLVPRRPRGATVPLGGKLSDFAALIGQPSAPESAADIAVEDLVKSVVRPYIVKGKDPQQAALLASLDNSLAVTMRKVLHHPDFQILESLWRSVDMLTRRIETSTQMQIVLYDVSAEEFAADLAASDDLEETGLFKLLVEQPALDANQGGLSAIIGAYVFDQTPPQAELLGRMAKLAARANAPFISSIAPDFLDTKPEDVHPLIQEAWDELRSIDEAGHLSLVTPRCLLRQPYGQRTDPITAFDDFEEFTPQTGLKGMLWGNPAFHAGLLLAQTYLKQGAKTNLGSIMTVDDVPYYFYVDNEGDQTALPCTERLINERVAGRISAEHFAALLSLKGRPEVRLGSFTALSGGPLAGRWPLPAGASAALPKEEAEEEAEAEASTEKPKKKKKKAKADAAIPAEPAADASGTAEAAPDGGGDAAAAESNAELDSLLASLQSDSDSKAAPAEGEAAADADIDPELAALLKGL